MLCFLGYAFVCFFEFFFPATRRDPPQKKRNSVSREGRDGVEKKSKKKVSLCSNDEGEGKKRAEIQDSGICVSRQEHKPSQQRSHSQTFFLKPFCSFSSEGIWGHTCALRRLRRVYTFAYPYECIDGLPLSLTSHGPSPYFCSETNIYIFSFLLVFMAKKEWKCLNNLHKWIQSRSIILWSSSPTPPQHANIQKHMILYLPCQTPSRQLSF